MIAPNPAFPVQGQNLAFRAWAKGQGLTVRRQPEPLQGEGDIWGVPLKGRRGWLWDASPTTIGLHLTGLPVYLNPRAEALSRRPGWRLQTRSYAVDKPCDRLWRLGEAPSEPEG